ncbi:MAG: hypothetical protein ACREPT_11685 [Rudaea sp.]
MLKFLILFPLALVGCAIGAALLLPLLALAPLLLLLALAIALPLLILRVLLGLILGIGGLIVGALGIGLAIAGAMLVLALGVVTAHLLLPVLLILGLVWLIRRAAKPAPLQLEHRPS